MASDGYSLYLSLNLKNCVGYYIQFANFDLGYIPGWFQDVEYISQCVDPFMSCQ
jgi:hypothetical protein